MILPTDISFLDLKQLVNVCLSIFGRVESNFLYMLKWWFLKKTFTDMIGFPLLVTNAENVYNWWQHYFNTKPQVESMLALPTVLPINYIITSHHFMSFVGFCWVTISQCSECGVLGWLIWWQRHLASPEIDSCAINEVHIRILKSVGFTLIRQGYITNTWSIT